MLEKEMVIITEIQQTTSQSKPTKQIRMTRSPYTEGKTSAESWNPTF